jgi:hypothetical protein
MKPTHPAFVVQPSRSSLLVWMLLCLIVALVLVLLIVQPALAQTQNALTAAEAKNHIGETVTVCGKVVSTQYAVSTKGQPTFLDLDQTYPDKVFTVVIWGSSRSKFSKSARVRPPEIEYKDRHICVNGKITKYRSVPEITVDHPFQIAVIIVAEGLPFRVKKDPIEQH